MRKTRVAEHERNVASFCRATSDILTDTHKRATNEEYPGRVDEIRAFVEERRAHILKEQL